MTDDEVRKIIEAYDALISRALQAVAPGCGFYADVEADNLPHLRIDGGIAILEWKEYESDYYGGGCLEDRSAEFPIELLLLNEPDFIGRQKMTQAEIKERERKLAAARAAIARDRQEAYERALYAQLKAKFGG